MKENRKFNLRSFISFSLVFATIIMSWSGFILYVAPPGRIANWGTWRLMLFTKTEWQALHTIFSYLFFILFVIHLFFINWKTFLTYIKSKLKAGLNRKWEMVSATIFSAVIFTGTLRSWAPFGPVMSFGEKVKEGWGNKFETPPVIHMETYTLKQLSPVLGDIPVSELLKTLSDSNLNINYSDSTLRQIAERNRVTPASVYNILATRYKVSSSAGHGEGQQGGYGKYTLRSVAEMSGRDLDDLILVLKDNGIEAEGGTMLRVIAERMGVSPRDVYDILTAGSER